MVFRRGVTGHDTRDRAEAGNLEMEGFRKDYRAYCEKLQRLLDELDGVFSEALRNTSQMFEQEDVMLEQEKVCEHAA